MVAYSSKEITVTCLSDDYLILKVERTMNVITILSLPISMGGKIHQCEEMPHHVNLRELKQCLDFRK